MQIENIKIKNFRSLENVALEFGKLNLFVGKNDSGKSNLLRTLDLFFNYNKGYDFIWVRDFCSFAKVGLRKAPEILISIDVKPSAGFRDQRSVTWTRVWRREGLHKDEVKYSDGAPLGGKTKVSSLLRNARLDYVPAIKGKDYFSELLASIHDMLERTVEKQIRSAATSFTKSINEHTTSIVDDILKQLGLKSSIELPSDLRELFSRLEFTSEVNGLRFSLEQRGDGIKARHIPIILRWLASQAETLSAPGRPKVVSTWAYEEPENNLELSSCLELADEMLIHSAKIQTFVSTHSPALYKVALDACADDVVVFGVSKASDLQHTEIVRMDNSDLSELDDSMGLIPLLQPEFRKALSRISQLQEARKELTNPTHPTVFVEGVSDKELLDEAVLLFYPQHKDSFQVLCAPHYGDAKTGGHTWVSDRIIAWGHLRSKVLAIGLFDKDQEAVDSRKKATEALTRKSNHCTKCLHLEPSEELKKIFPRGFAVPYAIDELFREVDWDAAEANDWLEERPNKMLLYGFTKEDQSFGEYLKDAIPEDELRRFVTHKLKLSKKKAFTNYLCDLPQDERLKAFLGVKPTLRKLLECFELSEDA
jgi:energy-coupling factor transporter ATP-binding protein EcfA2